MKKLKVGVGVSVIIHKGNLSLFMKRKGKHGDGQWSLPGGKLEFGESIEDCAIREVKEETGLDIKDPKFVYLTNDVFSEHNLHFITILMECDYIGGDFINEEPDKCSEIVWSRIDDISDDSMFLPLKKYYDEIYCNM